MNVFGKSLTNKVLLGVILASTVITIFATAFQLYIDYRSQFDLTRSDFDIVIKTHQEGIVNAVWDLNAEQAREQVKGLLNFPRVDFVRLEFDNIKGKTLIKAGVLPVENLSREHVLMRGDQNLGRIALYSDIKRIHAFMWDRLKFIVVMQSIKTFFASFLIMIVISHIVTRHIIDISNILADEEILDRYQPVTLKREKPQIDDELDLLVTKLNGMLQSIHDYKNNMQKMVDDKTTELKVSNEKLKNAVNAKSEFLANMSHEIRTPMNGILGAANILMQENLEKKHADYIWLIYDSTKSLLVIINDILDFSKIDSGKLELENIPVNLPQVVGDVIALFSESARKNNNIIEKVYPDELPHSIEGDPARLRQVLLNLLSNAVKFTHDGKITVKVEFLNQNDNHAELAISVMDTGIGMTDEQVKEIFSRFSQADSSTTRKYGGTGLGTTICKQLLELMNGKIEVESTKGVGSTFRIRLPVILCRQAGEKSRYIANESRDYQKTVLLAEDNPINQKIATKFLSKLGIEVIIANNGQEAIEMSKSKHDLVLMDIQMPEMDGLAATKALLAMNHDKPIVAMTANVFHEDIIKYKEAGFVDHIPKPYESADLIRVLDRFLH